MSHPHVETHHLQTRESSIPTKVLGTLVGLTLMDLALVLVAIRIGQLNWFDQVTMVAFTVLNVILLVGTVGLHRSSMKALQSAVHYHAMAARLHRDLVTLRDQAAVQDPGHQVGEPYL